MVIRYRTLQCASGPRRGTNAEFGLIRSARQTWAQFEHDIEGTGASLLQARLFDRHERVRLARHYLAAARGNKPDDRETIEKAVQCYGEKLANVLADGTQAE